MEYIRWLQNSGDYGKIVWKVHPTPIGWAPPGLAIGEEVGELLRVNILVGKLLHINVS
jgi:hypothetical protein